MTTFDPRTAPLADVGQQLTEHLKRCTAGCLATGWGDMCPAGDRLTDRLAAIVIPEADAYLDGIESSAEYAAFDAWMQGEGAA